MLFLLLVGTHWPHVPKTHGTDMSEKWEWINDTSSKSDHQAEKYSGLTEPKRIMRTQGF